MMVRRILAAIDLADSTPVAQYSFDLAAALGADVDVVHVVPGPGQGHAAVDALIGRPLPHTPAADVSRAGLALKDLVDRCDRHGILPTLIVETGDAATGIVRAAAEAPVDLIVVGTRGHRGVAEVVLGSVAHKVITCAPCPVVTLRRRT